MMATVLGFLNWAVLGVLPWWVWPILGGAAYMAVKLFLPPIPWLNDTAAVVLAVVIAGIGIKSWGYQEGTAHERTAWEHRIDLENQALKARIRLMEQAEERRTIEAAELDASSKRTTDEISRAVRGRGAIAIPSDIARRLYDDANGNGLIRSPGP